MLPKLLNSSSDNFFVLAGPCVIEGEEIVMQIAERLVKICSTYNIPLVFKGSYKKANRTRIDSFTGIGNEAALAILAKVRDTFNIPVVTDIHTEEEADLAAKYVDVLQIPAGVRATVIGCNIANITEYDTVSVNVFVIDGFFL